jgi:hypothetical protein
MISEVERGVIFMIFPKYRHTPIFDPERKRCPVCHHSVYSLAGIHPQCAIKHFVALESRGKRLAVSTAGLIETIERARQQVVLPDDDWQSQAEKGLCN